MALASSAQSTCGDFPCSLCGAFYCYHTKFPYPDITGINTTGYRYRDGPLQHMTGPFGLGSTLDVQALSSMDFVPIDEVEVEAPTHDKLEDAVVDDAHITHMDSGFCETAETTELWDKSVMKLNTQQWRIRANIRNNIKRFVPQLETHPESPQHIAIVGGGWSLKDPKVWEELTDLYHSGSVKIVALNGAGKFLMERNIRPSMQIILDGRPQNVEFLDKKIPKCKYFLASQVHPSLFDRAEELDLDTTIFHCVGFKDDPLKRRLDDHYLGQWTAVPSAGTIGMVAIMMCRLLGFRFQHIFGVDSCYAPPEPTTFEGKPLAHHAYEQKWNDDEGHATFRIGGRDFQCSAWQASQIQTFVEVIANNGDLINLEVHGDGALAHVLKTGASLAELSSLGSAEAEPDN